jgi:hypothetical protein
MKIVSDARQNMRNEILPIECSSEVQMQLHEYFLLYKPFSNLSISVCFDLVL